MPGDRSGFWFQGPSNFTPEYYQAQQQQADLLQQQLNQQVQSQIQTSEDLNQQQQNMLNQWAMGAGGQIDPATGLPVMDNLNPMTAPYMPNPTGQIGSAGSDIEDVWRPGVAEAQQIYNLGSPQLDPNNYLDQTMQSLMSMQNPQQNPYLDAMLAKSNQAISDQFLSALGSSGRGMSFDPVTGQVNDTAMNLIDQIGDNTRLFLGQQYQQDMNRAMQAALGGGDFMSGTLQMMQDQPWNNLQNYANITSQLTGSSPQQANDPKVSGWDRLIGAGTVVGSVLGIPGVLKP